MLDELRDHDSTPTAEEADWIAASAARLVFRAVVLAGIAILAGVTASAVIDQVGSPPAVAAAPRASR